MDGMIAIVESLVQTRTVPRAKIDDSDATSVSAAVAFSGAWNGWLVVSASPKAIASAAEIMLSTRLEAPTSDDVQEFALEIANVVSRCMKSILPSPVDGSLPFALRPRSVCGGAVDAVRVDFGGEWMDVTLVEGAHISDARKDS